MVTKVAIAVAEEEPEEGVALCRMRINDDVLRSHVYYDKAVFLLATIRVSENKGKKKLVEKIGKVVVRRQYSLQIGSIKAATMAPCPAKTHGRTGGAAAWPGLNRCCYRQELCQHAGLCGNLFNVQ